MRTVAQLREAGFVVGPAPDAIDCTEIISKTPFWFYRPEFASTMAEVHHELAAAPAHKEGWRLLVAGRFADQAVLPFNLLDTERKGFMDEARSRFIESRNNMQRAEADYMDALDTLNPYLA